MVAGGDGGADASDMEKECEVYLTAFTGTTVDYPAIVSYLRTVADGLVFMKVLLGNQVLIMNLVGRFSCGMGRPAADHNSIFRLLVEKLICYLPPIVMVPAVGWYRGSNWRHR